MYNQLLNRKYKNCAREDVYTEKQLGPVLFRASKKQSLPLPLIQIIQIWQMETYTDFGVSYPIQTFANKINTKSWNDCRVIPTTNFKISDKIFDILWNVRKCIVRTEVVVFTHLTDSHIYVTIFFQTELKHIWLSFGY